VGGNRSVAKFERGVREGWITPAKRPIRPLPPRLRPVAALEELLQELASRIVKIGDLS
jgi:hypothetical protein